MTFLFGPRFGEAGGRYLWTAAVGKPRYGLSGYRGDGVEVFVDVQDDQSRQLGGGRDDEIGDRRPSVLASIGQQQLDLQCAVFNFRGQVLNWHCSQRGFAELTSSDVTGLSRIPDFQTGQIADMDQAALDSIAPDLWLVAMREARQGRFVDQP